MKWLRSDEAAIWLGVSVPTVHVIAHREQWRRQRCGKRTLYSLEDVGATWEARQDDGQSGSPQTPRACRLTTEAT